MGIAAPVQGGQKLSGRRDGADDAARVQAMQQDEDMLPDAARRRADDMQDAHGLGGGRLSHGSDATRTG